MVTTTAIKTFPALQEQAHLPGRELFHYLQISNFFAPLHLGSIRSHEHVPPRGHMQLRLTQSMHYI